MRRCRARRPRDGQPCQAWAIKGGTVCIKHGGAAKQVRVKAARNVVKEKIGQLLLKEFGDVADPLEVLVTQLTQAAFSAAAYGRMVAGLEQIYRENNFGDHVPHVLISMWNEERDRAARFAKIALDSGVQERQVRVAQQQGALLAQVVQRMLEDPEFNLTASQRAAGRMVAARHLRALSEPVKSSSMATAPCRTSDSFQAP
ncbi:hypothetical protein BH20ACT21_BH20ACT21_25190 [soil metagenome]